MRINMAAPITINDISLPGLITLLACYQMASFARAVGAARRKYKISPPATDGDPRFVLVFRAQQNAVELFTMFLGIFWTSTLFFHKYVAAVFGLIYMIGRNKYFHDYSLDAKKRMKGFSLCVIAIQGLLLSSVAGLTQVLLNQYLGIDLGAFILKVIGY